MGDMEEQLFDVVAVDNSTNKVRFMAQGKTLANAEAIVSMAVMRRGLNEEFFTEVSTGKFKEGDEFTV